jgi:protein TonB
MELIQEKNSRSGVIGTILVHLLLLLLFVSFGMPYQDPPPATEGAMMIDFGDSGGGSPSEENPTEEKESSSSNAVNETETSETNSSQENAQTTDNETVDLNASNNSSTEETQETVSDNLSNALDALNNTNNNNSNSDNNNSNSSNNSDGKSNSNGTNTGPGSGIGYNLGGRGKISFKKPENLTQEDGKVVVDIIVDRNGKVLKAKAGARGSTTTNPILQKKAEEAAYKAKFKKDTDAPFEQKGTMTFVFILN